MKKRFLEILASSFVLALILVPFVRVSADEIQKVDTEDELIAALAKGGNIELEANITITEPLYVEKPTVIDGKTFKVSGPVLEENVKPEDGANRSIFTVRNTDQVVFKNITISDSTKYGIQAYNGGSYTVENVTIENCAYGAVLINGGTVTINSLILNNNKAGIEFAKGVNVQQSPALVMNGTIDATNQKDAIYIDEAQITEFTVENKEGSANKAVFNNNVLSIQDGDGNVIGQSNEMQNEITINIDGEVVVTEPAKTEEVTEPTVEVQKPEENPKTSDNVATYFVIAILGLGTLGLCTKKLINN